MAMSEINCMDKKRLLLWAAEFSLAICLIYSLFYVASSFGFQYFVLSNRAMVEQIVSGSVLPGPLDIAVWGIAIFVVLGWLGYDLELKNVKENCRSFSRVGLFVLLCGLAFWVVWFFLASLAFGLWF